MANVVKYTRQDARHMFTHYGRQAGETVQRGDGNIDPTRTHLNYDVHADSGVSGTQYQRLQTRLSEVKHMDLTKRKDINVMCDWCITLPKDVSSEKAREFFRHAYDFCADRYGKENVISAWVHMDETTPHMHFSFVPVVTDKDGTERLCAKERIGLRELKQFHKILQKYVEDKMQQPVGILNGKTVNGNLTIAEMKLRKIQEELAQKQAEKNIDEVLQKAIAEFEELMQGVRETFKEIDEELKHKNLFGKSKYDDTKHKEVTEKLDHVTEDFEESVKTMKRMKEIAESMPERVAGQFKEVIEQLDEPQKKLARRIKRAERKEKKLLEREQQLDEREHKIDEEVNQRVQQEMQKLDREIERKKKLSAQIGTGATTLQEFLQTTTRQPIEYPQSMTYPQALEQIQERSRKHGTVIE